MRVFQFAFCVIFLIFGGTLLAGAEEGKPIALFNGKDLSGWKRVSGDPANNPETTWTVHDGLLDCTGDPVGYIRTEKSYSNYRLQLEWRWVKKGDNSGVLIHVSGPDKVWPKAIEPQISKGQSGDLWLIEGFEVREHANKEDRRIAKLAEDSEKPLGEWNEMEVICRGNTLRVWVNSVLQNEVHDCSVTEGPIGLQSENHPIQFRRILLTPLAD